MGSHRSSGLTVAAAEARVPEHRLFIHRIRRGERILEAEPGTMLEAGDVIALSGPRQVIVEWIGQSRRGGRRQGAA